MSHGQGGWGRLKACLGVIGRGFVQSIDFLLRRAQGVREFSQREGCILRLSLGRAGMGQALSDGTVIRAGDPVGQIHLWNERLPLMGRAGADLAWARAFRFQFARSLEELAAYVAHEPSLAEVKAVYGEMAFTLADLEMARRFAQQMGFDFLERPGAASARGRWAQFWDNLYTLMLIWTYNPASLRGKALGQLRRYQLWISREKLLAHYARNRGKANASASENAMD